MGEGSPSDEVILAAAAQQVIERGAESLKLAELAAAVGVSRATIHRRLGGKAAILEKLRAAGAIEEREEPDIEARILQAARGVFTRDGLVEATVEQVAIEAGVGPATVYRRFGDKDGLISAFIVSSRPDIPWPDPQPGAPDFQAELLALTQTLLGSLTERRDIIMLLMSASEKRRSLMERLRVRPGRTQHHVEQFMGRLVAAGRLADVDARRASIAYMGLLVAFGVLGPMLGGLALGDREATSRFIVRVFLDGLRGDGDPSDPERGSADPQGGR